MKPSSGRIAQSADLLKDLIGLLVPMAIWTMIPIGVHTLATGRIESPHESAIFEGVLFIAVGSIVMIPFVVAAWRDATLEIGLFVFLASATTVAAALDRVSLSVFTGMGAGIALIWFHLSDYRKLRDNPSTAPAPEAARPLAEETRPVAEDARPDQDHAGQLVFYMLDSEEQALAAADRILACTSLTGLDDFVADCDPNLTVLEVVLVMAEADALLADDALDAGRRHEIAVLKQRICANGRAYVGY